MKRFMIFGAILFAFAVAFSQADLRERAMMKNTIFYALPDGKVASADYWQLQLGSFPIKVDRRFPGLGVVKMEGNANIAFMSGGYLEGNGFGGNPQVRSQRIATEADFAIRKDGKYEKIRPDTIDFIFFGGTLVKLKGENEPRDLFVYIEDPYNTDEPKRFTLAIYNHNKQMGELQYSHDVEPVAISFTQDGARRGFQANLAEANK